MESRMRTSDDGQEMLPRPIGDEIVNQDSGDRLGDPIGCTNNMYVMYCLPYGTGARSSQTPGLPPKPFGLE
ncbi:hypothetical protein RB213_001308 [Colletotrichum asianum]